MNNLKFLQEAISLLDQNGIKTWVFGGWAEELLKIIKPRDHKDIDLLYPAKNFDDVDAFFIKNPEIEEIMGKHFAHKRALLFKEIMVELFLVEEKNKEIFTIFWGEKKFYWPEDTFSQSPHKLRLVNPSALAKYRIHHAELTK